MLYPPWMGIYPFHYGASPMTPKMVIPLLLRLPVEPLRQRTKLAPRAGICLMKIRLILNSPTRMMILMSHHLVWLTVFLPVQGYTFIG